MVATGRPCYCWRMVNHAGDARRDIAEAVRRALVEAALGAYEGAGLSGLCAEGRWEAAVSALRTLDLEGVVHHTGAGGDPGGAP